MLILMLWGLQAITLLRLFWMDITRPMNALLKLLSGFWATSCLNPFSFSMSTYTYFGRSVLSWEIPATHVASKCGRVPRFLWKVEAVDSKSTDCFDQGFHEAVFRREAVVPVQRLRDVNPRRSSRKLGNSPADCLTPASFLWFAAFPFACSTLHMHPRSM